MRVVLAACVALSAVGFICATPARADEPYWREHSDWRAHSEFRDKQYQQETWQRDHCVRDWQGQEYCRR